MQGNESVYKFPLILSIHLIRWWWKGRMGGGYFICYERQCTQCMCLHSTTSGTNEKRFHFNKTVPRQRFFYTIRLVVFIALHRLAIHTKCHIFCDCSKVHKWKVYKWRHAWLQRVYVDEMCRKYTSISFSFFFNSYNSTYVVYMHAVCIKFWVYKSMKNRKITRAQTNIAKWRIHNHIHAHYTNNTVAHTYPKSLCI